MSRISSQRLRVPPYSSSKLECNSPKVFWRAFYPYMILGQALSNKKRLIIPRTTLLDTGYYCCATSGAYYDLIACSVIVIFSKATC